MPVVDIGALKVIESTEMVDPIYSQKGRPKSKKKRIINKWKKHRPITHYEPSKSALIFHDRIVVHPMYVQKIMEAQDLFFNKKGAI